MPTAIEHFSAITKDIVRDLTAKGIIRIISPATGEDLNIDSDEANELIVQITTSLYEGTVKEMNTHRAPDLT